MSLMKKYFIISDIFHDSDNFPFYFIFQKFVDINHKINFVCIPLKKPFPKMNSQA